MIKVIIAYFAAISIFLSAVTVFDKKAAIKGKQRVPENTLILLGMLGGSFFMFLTMKLIHHKTRKPKFMAGLPLIMLFQAAVIVLLIKYVDIFAVR